MNKTVEVTGMELKTKVGANLLISDNNYEADYTTQGLTQGRAALLEPVSSVTGADGSFFYTVNALGNGDAVTDAYTPYYESASGTALTGNAIDLITMANQAAGNHPHTSGAGKTHFDNTFNSTYTNSGSATANTIYANAYGYVDYVFYLKATGDSTNNYIKMTKCNLLYKGESAYGAVTTSGTVGDNVDKAWRVGVFCSAVTGGNGMQTSNATSENLKAILTLQGAANQSDLGSNNYAVSASNLAPTQMTLNYNTWAATPGNNAIATVADKATGYYMVTVRVWLEGEDTTCTSKTYAQLTNNWKLDCEFSMDANDNAVTSITSDAS